MQIKETLDEMEMHWQYIILNFVYWQSGGIHIQTEQLPQASLGQCSECYHNKSANTCSFISLATSVVTACTVYRQVGSFFAARASFVSLTATERASGLDLRVGKSDSPHFESPWTGGGREPAALSGNLQVAKLFKALLSTLGCPL